MARARAGEFAALYERHFEDVYRYVAFRLGGRGEAASELVQEVFLAALEGWPGYRADGPALSWLRGIARRKVADHFRRPAGRLPATDDVPAAPRPAESPDADRAAIVSGIMRSLPAEQADLLEEKYLEGLSVRQMAARRGRTEKAIESALARARDAFRSRFLRAVGGKEPEP